MLHTLGGLRLQGHAVQQPKLLLVLAYLALEGPRERAHLQRLFWPEAGDAANNLRVALRRLRLGAPTLLSLEGPLVVVTVPTDVHELVAASKGDQHGRVVDLYRGRFLDGSEPADAGEELEDWIYHTRETLAARVRRSRLYLAEAAAAQGQGRLAAAHAEAAYLLPGAPEPEDEELRRLHLLLEAAHSPLAADVRREAQTYGLKWLPAPAAPETAPEARASPVLRPGPAPALPTFGTSFIGRQAEQRAMQRLLADPACRMLSVVGPGGIGKTRLAVQLAAALQGTAAFSDGVYFVNLAPVTGASHLPLAVAETLHLTLQGTDEPLAQVQRALTGTRRLLVLDNFEHLIPAAPQLVALLETCAHLKLLVTSRERLNVQEEWVFALEGLATPLANTGELDEDRSPAPVLFVQRARRSDPSFSPTPDVTPDILELCRVVGGVPLAIELAATWIRALSVGEILQELRRSLDFLADVNGRGPPRHASLRAVFGHSWQLLDAREQGALARLSVFRSPFTREAAAEVARTPLPLLTALIDKSLLRRLPDRLYGRHPLLYEHTREKLAERPAEEASTQAAHARYFLRRLRAAEEALGGPEQRAALHSLEPQAENLRAAWMWAAGRDELETLRETARSLRVFFDAGGRYREGLEVLRETVQMLEHRPPGQHLPGPATLLGELHVHQAILLLRLGALHEASVAVRRGLTLLRGHGGEAVTEGLDVCGVLELRAGRYDRARRYWTRALARSGEHADPLTARLWGRLGIAEQWLGHYAEAEAWYRQALHLGRVLDRPADVTRLLNNLAAMFIATARFGEARSLLEEGLAHARDLALTHSRVHFLNNLAVVDTALGQWDAARIHGEAALALVRDLGNPPLEAEVLETLGRLDLAENRLDAARTHFTGSLVLAWTLRQWLVVLQDLEGLAQLRGREGQAAQAAPLLQLVARHPAATRELVTRANEALGTLVPDVAQDGAVNWPAVRHDPLEEEVARVVGMILEERP